jgi:hypothetical protein
MAVHHLIIEALLREKRDLDEIPLDEYWVTAAVSYWNDSTVIRTNICRSMMRPENVSEERFREGAALLLLIVNSDDLIKSQSLLPTSSIERCELIHCMPLRNAIDVARTFLKITSPQ